MARVVYNDHNGYDGLNMPREAVLLGRELSGDKLWGGVCLYGDPWAYDNCGVGTYPCDTGGSIEDRCDPTLLEVYDRLAGTGVLAHLSVRDVPGGVKYVIERTESYGEEVILESEFEWCVAH